MIRLLLRPGTRYEERRDEFLPFDRIVDPNPEMRAQVTGLLRRGGPIGREVFVLVNNKAEGCSPLTIRALAERLPARTAAELRLTGLAAPAPGRTSCRSPPAPIEVRLR